MFSVGERDGERKEEGGREKIDSEIKQKGKYRKSFRDRLTEIHYKCE